MAPNLSLAALAAAAALSTFAAMVHGHGGLTFPPSRNNFHNKDPTVRNASSNTFHNNGAFCTGDECLWFNEGCWIGCPTNCSSKMPLNNPKAKGHEKSPEFTWNTYGEPNCENWSPMEPTLPDKFRTYNLGNPSAMGDWSKYHPWRAPGHSPTVDPCGIGGAYLVEKEGGIAPEGSKLFARGSELPVGVRTEWHAGAVVEVGWMVGSNHGGGYLYSLCPAGEALTEHCFQMRTLPFVGSDHTIRYLDNKTMGLQNKTEFTIPAMDVSEGTWPKGSAWRRNPIPACNCDRGDSCSAKNGTIDLMKAYADEGPPQPKGDAGAGNDCRTGTQFPVPFPYGYGQHLWYNKQDGPSRDMWAIFDQVQLPNTTGDFVLRWRWDTEQNPQIWSHCADVRIVAPAPTTAPAAVCKESEFCCPDAKHCLTPTNTSCAAASSKCATGQVCCPLTKICVVPGAACASPCRDQAAYCCPDAKHCLTPTNPGHFCKADAECRGTEVCCPLTKLCVKVGAACTPPLQQPPFMRAL